MESHWKTAAGVGLGAVGGGLIGWLGALAYKALKPMTFDDADQKAEQLIDAEIEKTKTESKRKALPKYVLAMLGRLRSSVASELWDAYDRGKQVGVHDGRVAAIGEIREFITDQADMAEQRAKSENGKEWASVARELRAAAGVMNRRHGRG